MPEEEAKPTEPVINTATLAEQISQGIAKALPEAMRAAQPERAEAPPLRPAPLPAIDDPQDDEFVAAVSAGDTAKAANIRSRQRAADRERIRRDDLSPILTNGGAALASVAKQLAVNLPHYKRFKKEIDGRVSAWQNANPGAVPTFEHYKWAHDGIIGENWEMLSRETTEAAVRKAREPEEALLPENQRHLDQTPQEPATLNEALVGDWNGEFKRKSKAFGGRSDDEEMKKAGFGNVKGFLAARKQIVALNEEMDSESCGLDREYDKRAKRYLTEEESRYLPLTQ